MPLVLYGWPAASEGTRIYSELVISAFAGKMSIYMNNFSYYNGLLKAELLTGHMR
jgi:hypothetical protein